MPVQGGCARPHDGRSKHDHLAEPHKLEENATEYSFLMTTTYETKKRRAWQTLFSQLDKHLTPYLGSRLVLAISGGPDSRALLEAIARWPARIKTQWLVVSIDHGVRHQSAEEAIFVAMRAKSLGFSARVETFFATGKENEQKLREKRYTLLMQIAQEFGTTLICTAHHRDDNAEGFLMSLLGVGGGAAGAAMAASEERGQHIILRPFVGLGKNELLLALSLSGYTDFAVDNLDQDRVGQRAFVRHEILPVLVSHNPQAAQRLDLFAREERLKKRALHRLALPLITWTADGALIKLNSPIEPFVLELAIRVVLKKCCAHLDLRQSRITVQKLAAYALQEKSEFEPGLDRPSKLFIVKALETKIYQLPGALARACGKEIVIRRV